MNSKTRAETISLEAVGKGKQRNGGSQQAKDFPRDRQGQDFRWARGTNESSRDETQVLESASECELGEARARGDQEVG